MVPQEVLSNAKDRRFPSADLDFVGLHNVAKHFVFFTGASDAVHSTVKGICAQHKKILADPPQGAYSKQITEEVDLLLSQKATQYEVLTLRAASMEKRMQNIINLVRQCRSEWREIISSD